jgi:hypothetical protein
MDLQLVEVTDDYRNAVQSGAGQLAQKLGLLIPTGWPIFPDFFNHPATPDWPFFFFIDKASGSLVGSGGFLSAPDSLGRVQIGYEIAPDFRGSGLATASMRLVLALRPGAQSVALTDQPTGPSASVLAKLGFVLSGTIQPASSGLMYLWALNAGAA